jgi:hypothetical protein
VKGKLRLSPVFHGIGVDGPGHRSASKRTAASAPPMPGSPAPEIAGERPRSLKASVAGSNAICYSDVRGTALSSERTMTRPDRRPPHPRRNPATGLRDGDGRPAALAVQPKFLDSEAAFLSGCVAQVASLGEIDILHLPEEFGWLSCPPSRARSSSGF